MRRIVLVVVACLLAALLAALLVPALAAATPRLAFTRSNGEGSPGHLFTVEADGGGLTQLTGGTAFDLAPAWSPGRGTIAFIRSRSGNTYDRKAWVMLMRSDGSNKRTLKYTGPSLTSGTHVLAYSPNGRHLAGGTSLRTGSRWAVTVLDLRTRRSHVIYSYPCENGIVSLTWSPDGSQLVANVEYGGGYGMFRIDVAHRRLLKSYKLNAGSAAWLPGGRSLLCTQWFPEEPDHPTRTTLRRLDGRLIKTVGQGQGHVVYSPDGSEYAFLDYSPAGSAAIKRAKADGSSIRTVYQGADEEYVWPAAWR
jgi:Tol biopolymer transport system component